MLLRELAEQARLRGAVQAAGYKEQPVVWEVVLSPAAAGAALRRLDGPKGEKLLVPDVTRTSGVRPFPCADKAGYALAVPKKAAPGSDGTKETVAAGTRAGAFTEMAARCADATGEPSVRVLADWLAAGRPGLFDEDLAQVAESDRVCFRVEGQPVRLHELPAVRSWWSDQVDADKGSGTGWCLVCGRTGQIAITFPQTIKAGSLGKDGAALVSSNFPSFGRQSQTQLGAAPVCLRCAQASVAGLQSLLDTQYVRDGHRQAVRLADDRRLVFWVPDSPDGPDIVDLLADPDPSHVARLLDAPRTADAPGFPGAGDQLASAVLGINATRVVVHDQHRASLDEVEAHVRAWFADSRTPPAFPDDMRPAGQAGHQSIPDIERALTNPKATTTRLPGAGEALWKTALYGAVLPPALLAHAVNRERIEGVTAHSRNGAERRDARRRSAARIALLQLLHTRHLTKGTPVTPHPTAAAPTAADPLETAVLLGRLFACLENLQRAALGGGVNAPIGARWSGRASTSPVAAYPALLRNATHHLNKLRKTNGGLAHVLQAELDLLVAGVPRFPAHLPLPEQGAWFLGLHRQRAEQAARRALSAGRNDHTIGAQDHGPADAEPEQALA